jgi:hypothetical protein
VNEQRHETVYPSYHARRQQNTQICDKGTESRQKTLVEQGKQRLLSRDESRATAFFCWLRFLRGQESTNVQ